MPKMIYSNNNDDNEVAPKDEGEEAKETTKKGPWTTAEDSMLREYVLKYGEGNWNSVQKNSGLARCGKSCRLRWANHLRPSLKKGAFSKEEEQIIVHLHAKLGNKWARMAAQLPGRTDNEIKNFWNTRMKRRQRAGLPLYLPEVQHEVNTYHPQHKQYFAQPHPSSSFPPSSLITPSNRQELKELSHSSAANLQQNQLESSCYTNPYPQFKFPNDKSGNGNMGLPSSPVSPYGSSSSCFFNHSFAANDSHDYRSGSYNLAQSPPGSITSASSHASGVYGLVGASSMANGYYEVAPLSPQGNTGLLDDLVVEAQNLSNNDWSKSKDSITAVKLSCKRKSMVGEVYIEEKGTVLVKSSATKISVNTTNKTHKVDSNSSQFSAGKKPIAEDPLGGMNSMDDDLFSLLNNFPAEMPVPEWCHEGERQPLGHETQEDASLGPADQEFAWTLGTVWSNMPNIS